MEFLKEKYNKLNEENLQLIEKLEEITNNQEKERKENEELKRQLHEKLEEITKNQEKERKENEELKRELHELRSKNQSPVNNEWGNGNWDNWEKTEPVEKCKKCNSNLKNFEVEICGACKLENKKCKECEKMECNCKFVKGAINYYTIRFKNEEILNLEELKESIKRGDNEIIIDYNDKKDKNILKKSRKINIKILKRRVEIHEKLREEFGESILEEALEYRNTEYGGMVKPAENSTVTQQFSKALMAFYTRHGDKIKICGECCLPVQVEDMDGIFCKECKNIPKEVEAIITKEVIEVIETRAKCQRHGEYDGEYCKECDNGELTVFCKECENYGFKGELYNKNFWKNHYYNLNNSNYDSMDSTGGMYCLKKKEYVKLEKISKETGDMIEKAVQKFSEVPANVAIKKWEEYQNYVEKGFPEGATDMNTIGGFIYGNGKQREDIETKCICWRGHGYCKKHEHEIEIDRNSKRCISCEKGLSLQNQPNQRKEFDYSQWDQTNDIDQNINWGPSERSTWGDEVNDTYASRVQNRNNNRKRFPYNSKSNENLRGNNYQEQNRRILQRPTSMGNLRQGFVMDQKEVDRRIRIILDMSNTKKGVINRKVEEQNLPCKKCNAVIGEFHVYMGVTKCRKCLEDLVKNPRTWECIVEELNDMKNSARELGINLKGVTNYQKLRRDAEGNNYVRRKW
ncbi:uncharacterized protein OCT59_024776 [Rhizophagus irregularis]|uniref:Uncharacterized protein n=4 Tax=Rhizophagus irregularis TaxID=588596 RepID=A0A915ZB83_9GLOM|nr:hypothetical protein RirG_029230 [Rhizophagus irregularis DAOM 197198w]UZO04390.1 hypothetical protein OCT59_024776 [Rhizophagus irregularis]GBC19506.1 hypothetical protein GLOIN_2v1556772 [Rhizophagus irregularis DAOM 181602=DAOM 197198]CAB4489045.1 unnamed protein product [Rhizophagus irregularis]CAB5198325.1 unnamed protein product [Rhizophagus irregularis]